VWCQDRDGDNAWILAEITKKTDEELHLTPIANPDHPEISQTPITRTRVTSKDDPTLVKFDGVELANAKLSDEDRATGADDDLITLPHLHEPALLHAIAQRFKFNKIYTWTGPVLIAVNPFQRLPMYTSDILESYRREGLMRSQNIYNDKPLGPHVYSIADRSFRQMMTNRKSQSILISGESGAGKTETTKIVMLYLTTLGMGKEQEIADNEEKKEELSVMERVLQSNPILETFGNAKTLRNDNSSRFGKFIELGFSKRGVLLGAKVHTYLLEKVRLGFHASGERNYHIFYQILRGASDEQKRKWGFHDADTGGLELVNYYHFTGQGGAPQLREFTDEAGLKYTLKSMRAMGWQEDKIDNVLAIGASILHLGQTQFEGKEDSSGEEIAEIGNENIVNLCGELMGVDIEKLKMALTVRVMLTRGEEIKIQLSPAKASDARDALAKTLYGAIFLWVVSQVNKCVGWEDDNEVRNSIGVLDIFGFECFAINSFEQLCINYTNEALQQQFNKFIFKMEQDEYNNESIDWAFISFPDNQDCLDTIQSRPSGLLAMLDDECKLGTRGSDKNWATRLYKHYLPEKKQAISDNGRFRATAMQKVKNLFCILHFAGIVTYTATTNFLEKNRDEIPLTAKKLFETAPNQLIREIYEVQRKDVEERDAPKKTETPAKPKPGPARGRGRGGGGKPAKQKTVAQQFKEQLNQLITNVESTEPHYIRCLKPNDAAKPLIITRKRTCEQLRYGGVLEAVRVARMGYPVRLTHESFFKRYRMLLPTVDEDTLTWCLEDGEPAKLCEELLRIMLDCKGAVPQDDSRASQIRDTMKKPDLMDFPKSEVQLGSSKVFLRKPPHDAFEAHRVYHQNVYAIMLQSVIRGCQQYRRYIILHMATCTVERWYRGCKGRERWWRLREADAGQLLTNAFHMIIYRRKYARAKRGTIQLEALIRGRNTRRRLALTTLQSHYRMYKKHLHFTMLKSASIALQCKIRVSIAKSVLKGLMGEQKDIGKLKENNEKLKLEMASLKAMLSAQAQGAANNEAHNLALAEKQKEIDQLEKRVAELEKEIASKKQQVDRLTNDVTTLKQTSEATIEQLKSQIANAPKEVVHVPVAATAVRPINGSAAPAANSAVIAQHLDEIARLEDELKKEQLCRQEANTEIIKLRAQMSGVTIDFNSPPKPAVEKRKSAPAISMRSQSMSSLPEGDEDEEQESPKKGVRAENNLSQSAPSTGASTVPPEVTGAEDQQPSTPTSPQRTTAKAPPPPPPPPQSPAKDGKKEDEETKRLKKEAVTPEVINALGKLGITGVKEHDVFSSEKKKEEPKRRPLMTRSPSDYFPMVRRGFISMEKEEDKEEEEVMAVGWKTEITNRKEREESLRDDVRRFEIKMKRFYSNMEEGVDVVMWQLNKITEGEKKDDFPLKASPINLKLHRRGELLVQAVITFSTRGGYLSKALGRTDKSAVDPLALHEVLEVAAGCMGYTHTDLPSTSKSKDKKDPANKHASLFLTLKASPTPVAAARLYILRFKSRSARNDLMNGLRALLADLQIREGVGISSIHAPRGSSSRASMTSNRQPQRRMPNANSQVAQEQQIRQVPQKERPNAEDIMIPLTDVHKAINKERKMYDRLLLMLLQGSDDLKRKEEEMLKLQGKLDTTIAESAEKDRVQSNDSKLIMQLSKKLETLLMDNEDLRDQNDRLNTRLVQVECEKMNLMG